MCSAQDPDDVGFVQWRSVFYIAGDLNNFLLLLDGFFVWKEKSIAQSVPFQVWTLGNRPLPPAAQPQSKFYINITDLHK